MVDKNLSKVCLDASVVIKTLVKEKDSDLAATLFREIWRGNVSVLEPTFLRMEICSTLRKKSYLQEINKKEFRTAATFFRKLDFKYIFEEQGLLSLSYQLAEKLELPVIYDCLYLALAKNEKAIFITADPKFVNKTKVVYPMSFSLRETATQGWFLNQLSG